MPKSLELLGWTWKYGQYSTGSDETEMPLSLVTKSSPHQLPPPPTTTNTTTTTTSNKHHHHQQQTPPPPGTNTTTINNNKHHHHQQTPPPTTNHSPPIQKQFFTPFIGNPVYHKKIKLDGIEGLFPVFNSRRFLAEIWGASAVNSAFPRVDAACVNKSPSLAHPYNENPNKLIDYLYEIHNSALESSARAPASSKGREKRGRGRRKGKRRREGDRKREKEERGREKARRREGGDKEKEREGDKERERRVVQLSIISWILHYQQPLVANIKNCRQHKRKTSSSLNFLQ
ncbi:hypothetical protein FHG87_018514 [Trinorchestia longiramus]|nr:hypothetical protein FHG87_018514 [Trinorchestia longiramus]